MSDQFFAAKQSLIVTVYLSLSLSLSLSMPLSLVPSVLARNKYLCTKIKEKKFRICSAKLELDFRIRVWDTFKVEIS